MSELPPDRPCFHCGLVAWEWTEQPVLWDFPNWQCASCSHETLATIEASRVKKSPQLRLVYSAEQELQLWDK